MAQLITKQIQNEILKELLPARSSIKVAVAWFTSKVLFLTLMTKLEQGLHIEIILNDDAINKNSDSLDFQSFIKTGGVIHWVDSRFIMHDKFCIIDDKVVFNGSYNWTNMAEYNNENVMLFKDDINIVSQCNALFDELAEKYPACNNTIMHEPCLDFSNIHNCKLNDYTPFTILPYYSNWNSDNLNFIDFFNTNINSINLESITLPFHLSPKYDNKHDRYNHKVWPEYILSRYHTIKELSLENNGDNITKLCFFEKIKVVNELQCGYISQDSSGKYFLLDKDYFSPLSYYAFEDYKIVYDYDKKLIWVKYFNKWSLLDVTSRKALTPRFNNYHDDFFVFNNKKGYNIMTGDGKVLLRNDYDIIDINTKFRIPHAVLSHGKLSGLLLLNELKLYPCLFTNKDIDNFLKLYQSN